MGLALTNLVNFVQRRVRFPMKVTERGAVVGWGIALPTGLKVSTSFTWHWYLKKGTITCKFSSNTIIVMLKRVTPLHGQQLKGECSR